MLLCRSPKKVKRKKCRHNVHPRTNRVKRPAIKSSKFHVLTLLSQGSIVFQPYLIFIIAIILLLAKILEKSMLKWDFFAKSESQMVPLNISVQKSCRSSVNFIPNHLQFVSVIFINLWNQT